MCIVLSPSGECYLAVDGKQPPVWINLRPLWTENSVCMSYLSVHTENSLQ